jgi:hypothetical protein
MGISAEFHECLTIAENSLAANESIVQFRLAVPDASRADYFMRFKAYVGVLDPSNSSITAKRCFVIKRSSNTGAIVVDTTVQCDSLTDVW